MKKKNIKKQNSNFGLTTQYYICKKYNIIPNNTAKKQFASALHKPYEEILNPIIVKIFKEIKSKPVKCTTYKLSQDEKEKYLPYNFILSNGKTLSIRTTKTSSKIAPRVVGQAGYEKLNNFFSPYYGKKILNQEDIKKCIYNNISDMLPIFIDYLLNANYTVFINLNNQKHNTFENIDYFVINDSYVVNESFSSKDLTFTKDLNSWNESITLKYKNISIAEIQVHLKRAFKFRFIITNFISFIEEEKITTETLGITAEKAICDLYNLTYPENFYNRYSKKIQNDISYCVSEAMKNIPKPIRHTGSDPGSYGKNSKASYDFLLDGNKKLSVKTNYGKFVCPPEVGQPSDKTFLYFFGTLFNIEKVDETIFKEIVLENIELLIPIYLEHLFDSDYLLRIYFEKKYKYQIVKKDYGANFKWKEELFSFTKDTVEDWNECTTVKYNKITLGQFQVHRNRNSYKFRFHFPNLIKIIYKNR